VAPLLAADAPNCLVANAWICGEYLRTRSDELIAATRQHVVITVISVLIGVAIAFPLALVARRWPRLEIVLLGITTAIYTIPSIALFSLLIAFSGLGSDTVVIGLVLYSLTILLRNILAGLAGVPDDVREAARGMGFGSARMLWKVELPLAMPSIMAGLRVATVSTVALVTIGAIVGAGGLGTLLYQAIPSAFKAQIFTASVLCVLLAIAFDLVLLGVQRLLTPWTRRAS
jgi:osmoprotectant transport system permease protein